MAPSADWDEIKRLAADFQKAQLSSTVQRLSERNCIEIVTKLIELKLVDVIFTNDGKEYLTHQQLIREIKDELYIHGGRVNTVDLAKELNVDLNQINNCVAEITKGKDVQLVSGYLIADYYLEKIAREINEKLQVQGKISIGELTLQYDLPAELLQHRVLEYFLNKIIIGSQDSSDSRIFYTEEFIARTKAKIRGALIGLLKPTPISVIINHCNLTERLFLTLFDQLNAPGVLTGRQTGSSYIPSCYTKSQNEWVTNFYKQNNYLEYDAIARLGLSEPKTFVKRLLPNEDLMFLSTCVVGPQIKQQLETALEDCIMSKTYLDVVSLLPSVFSDADIGIMLDSLLKNDYKSTVVFEKTVLSNHFIDNLKESCIPMVKSKVDGIVKSGKYQQYSLERQLSSKVESFTPAHIDHKAERREERRRKATSGKGGGGTQGRETKTKAVKKHSRPAKNMAHDSDSDDQGVSRNPAHLEIVTIEDIQNSIRESLEHEGLDDLLFQISKHLQGTLNQIAVSMAKEAAEKLLQNASQNRKQTHSIAQDKINILVNDIKLYEKGLKMFPLDLQPQFVKYLLKSLGNDVLAEFCKYAANQSNLPIQSDTLTIEQRNKIINDLTDEYTKPFKELNASISDNNMEMFYQAVDSCLTSCGMILKKIDKKKDKLLVQNHREKLILELADCEEPALVLHLATLAIFTIVTQNMLYASGRQVALIISFLRNQLKEEQIEQLQLYHELVTKYLMGNEEVKSELHDTLHIEIPAMKKLVKSIK